MQAAKVNSCDIQLFKSILEMFNGTAQFVIENPWYDFKTLVKKKSKENFMNEYKEIKSQYGTIDYLT